MPTASTYMNFVYDPKIAAQWAVGANYISSVKGVMGEAVKLDPKAEDNPLTSRATRLSLRCTRTIPRCCETPTTRRGGWKSRGIGPHMGAFFHRHRRRNPVPPARARGPLARDLLPHPAGVPGVRVAADGALPPLSIHLGVLELLGRDLGLPRTAPPLVLLRGDRDLACLLLAYPLAYWIAFRAGPWRNLFLLFIVAPFFVTYLVRTLAWQNILADQGPVVGFLRDATCSARTGGSWRRRSRSWRGSPTTSSPSWRCRCTSPSSRSTRGSWKQRRTSTPRHEGVPARDAAAFDAGRRRRNAADLHPCGRRLHQRGASRDPEAADDRNVIQAKFLESLDYPTAAALSFVLMGTILVPCSSTRASSARRGSPDDGDAAQTVSRASPRARQPGGRFVKRHALTVYALLAVAYLMLPIAVVILFSFNDPAGRFNYVWEGFTLENWVHWDAVLGIRGAIVTSFEVALLATVVRPPWARSWRWRLCAIASSVAARRTSSSSYRCRRPRSSWARRSWRCSSTRQPCSSSAS